MEASWLKPLGRVAFQGICWKFPMIRERIIFIDNLFRRKDVTSTKKFVKQLTEGKHFYCCDSIQASEVICPLIAVLPN